ncbi:hypothetical protein ASG87_00950 [Frateuria sp. Soil773]|uniref:hypothetical protein n=1 Tax=Frateuria sp. Soil773 TaxID=1736407 RepID=UPI0006F80C65|nr:hypothetical protein [Frateuria sp. Soil773]KRE92512.1 hypothetical protein ASG87_00950 [Frateuria sp. Soil773]
MPVNGIVLGVVTVLHLALLVALLRPLAPRSPAALPMASKEARRALRVRLLAAPLRREAFRPAANARAAALPKRPAASPARHTEPPLPVEAALATGPVKLSLPPATVPAVPGYVAGGGFRLPDAAPAIRLPGAPRAHAPAFRMIDPKLRGLGGVVHLIGALAGAQDPACLDVEVWRTMSIETLLEHHVTPAQVARTADEHRCAEPRHGLVIRW